VTPPQRAVLRKLAELAPSDARELAGKELASARALAGRGLVEVVAKFDRTRTPPHRIFRWRLTTRGRAHLERLS
jgi:hypothetical protein